MELFDAIKLLLLQIILVDDYENSTYSILFLLTIC